MTIERSLSLMLAADNWRYPGAGAVEQISADNYYLAAQLPLDELLSTRPIDVAIEVIHMTMASDWRGKGRRPARLGDIMGIGRDAWMFCRVDDIKKPRMKQHESIVLLDAPEYAIVRVPGDMEELLCQPA